MKNRPLMPLLTTGAILARFASLLQTPFFWIVSLWGNIFILSGALLFHFAENSTNPSVPQFIDSLSWAVGVVTTVGAGSIAPITVAGKILSIVMMMGGAIFLWSYMALFVGVLVDPELRKIEREVSAIQAEVKGDDEALEKIRHLLDQIQRQRTKD